MEKAEFTLLDLFLQESEESSEETGSTLSSKLSLVVGGQRSA